MLYEYLLTIIIIHLIGIIFALDMPRYAPASLGFA